MSERRLIVGLGNPGSDYQYTRHNIGFLVVGQLAEQFGLKFGPSSFTKAYEAEGIIDSTPVKLLLPLTYMNRSGTAVKQTIDKDETSLKNLLVICDDVNLSFEKMRLRKKGSDGGNNGLASVIEKLESMEFARLRLGIGQPSPGQDMAQYVLEEFAKSEKDFLKRFVEQAVECCRMWLSDEVDTVMAKYNG